MGTEKICAYIDPLANKPFFHHRKNYDLIYGTKEQRHPLGSQNGEENTVLRATNTEVVFVQLKLCLNCLYLNFVQ